MSSARKSNITMISDEEALVGKSLDNVFAHFRDRAAAAGALVDLESTKFRKKDLPLSQGIKSTLKHRIQAATGRQFKDIEEELGYSQVKHGTTMSVPDIRILASLIILEGNGALEKKMQAAAGPPSDVVENGRPGTSGAGRKRKSESVSTPAAEADSSAGPGKRARSSGRKSIASVHQLTPVPKRATPRRSLAVSMPIPEERDPDPDNIPEEQDLNMGLENPTPNMLAVAKRRSVAAVGGNFCGNTTTTKRGKSPAARRSLAVPAAIPEEKTTPKKAVSPAARRPAAIPEQKKKTPKTTPKRPVLGLSAPLPKPATKWFTGKAFEAGRQRGEHCKIYLAKANTTDPNCLKLDSVRYEIPDFPGANLTLLHTLAEWGPPEVFSAVMSIRSMNRGAGLNSFLVLVGCGISNVHMYREALLRQTRHVQFVVFEREDADPGADWRLRDTCSYFLLAYFFPGCDKLSVAGPPSQMVRDGAGTCIRTASVEDLENNIVHVFSEEGDWVLDYACKKRELTLAAQKAGRNAIALDDDEDNLAAIEDKAAPIAAYHDYTFREDIDGEIIAF